MILLSLLYNIRKKENFSTEKGESDILKTLYLYMMGYNPDLEYKDLTIGDMFLIILIYIVLLMISIYASYLSLSCTWNGLVENIFIRLIFALIAFILGPIYFIWYFFVNYLTGACKKG